MYLHPTLRTTEHWFLVLTYDDSSPSMGTLSRVFISGLCYLELATDLVGILKSQHILH